MFLKTTHLARNEAAAARREEKKRKEKERILQVSIQFVRWNMDQKWFRLPDEFAGRRPGQATQMGGERDEETNEEEDS